MLPTGIPSAASPFSLSFPEIFLSLLDLQAPSHWQVHGAVLGSGLDAKITPGLEPAAGGDVVQPLHWELGEKLEPELKDSPREIFLKDSLKKLQQLDLSFPSPPCDAWISSVDTHKHTVSPGQGTQPWCSSILTSDNLDKFSY